MKRTITLTLLASFATAQYRPSLQDVLTRGSDAVHKTNDQNFDELFDSRVESYLRHLHVPGISIAVINGNETYAKGYGHAVISSEPATPHTLYGVGSTTKSFTAASMLKLIEAFAKHHDPITLKTKISDLIRAEFVLSDPYATAHVTLEDALSHRTGLPVHDASYGGANGSLASLVRGMRYLPFTAELREKWQYNNMMYMAVSHVIERLTGKWLGDYMRETIWRPLGMESTYLGLPDARRGSARLATGYRWNNVSQKYSSVEYVDKHVISGAGNIISNVLDYAKYLRAMIAKDPAVLSAASYDELRTPRAFSNPRSGEKEEGWMGPEMYSLGWSVTHYHGYEVFSHGGSIGGFGTQMAYVPGMKDGVGFVAMANTAGTSNLVAWAIMFDVLDEMLGVPAGKRKDWMKLFDDFLSEVRGGLTPEATRKKLYPDAPPPDKALPLPIPIENYAGTYRSEGYNALTVDCVNFIDLPRQPHDGLQAEKVLYVEVTDKIWHHDIVFEHVSGNYFIAWMDHHVDEVLEKRVSVARFELDAGGRVAKLGIEYEPEMGHKDLIWFDRIA